MILSSDNTRKDRILVIESSSDVKVMNVSSSRETSASHNCGASYAADASNQKVALAQNGRRRHLADLSILQTVLGDHYRTLAPHIEHGKLSTALINHFTIFMKFMKCKLGRRDYQASTGAIPSGYN